MESTVTSPTPNEKTAHGDSVEARFQRIEVILEKVANRLEAGAVSNQPLMNKNPSIAEAPSKNSSKLILAGVFSVIGLKLGGLLGSNIGAIFDVGGFFKGPQAVKPNLTGGFFKDIANADYMRYFRFTLIGSAIGTVSGAIGGAMLGWTRGDRLNEPGDLLKHPIESLNVIFSKKESKAVVTQASSPQPKITANRVHEGTQNSVPQMSITSNQ